MHIRGAMKVTTGKIKDRAQSFVDYTAAADSTSVLKIGEASGDSQSHVKVTELPTSVDMAQLAKELDRLSTEMRGDRPTEMSSTEVAAIDSARDAAREGDRVRAGEYLLKAGKWALDVATKIGVPIATEALKNLIK